MASGHLALVLTALLLTASHAAAQTPSAGEFGAPRIVVPMSGKPTVARCRAEFAKLLEEAKMKGTAAKAASQRQVGRKEMCEYIKAYIAAEARWINFTDVSVRTCGISSTTVNMLHQVHANAEQLQIKVCAELQ
jgi:hypothetical protein